MKCYLIRDATPTLSVNQWWKEWISLAWGRKWLTKRKHIKGFAERYVSFPQPLSQNKDCKLFNPLILECTTSNSPSRLQRSKCNSFHTQAWKGRLWNRLSSVSSTKEYILLWIVFSWNRHQQCWQCLAFQGEWAGQFQSTLADNVWFVLKITATANSKCPQSSKKLLSIPILVTARILPNAGNFLSSYDLDIVAVALLAWRNIKCNKVLVFGIIA